MNKVILLIFVGVLLPKISRATSVQYKDICKWVEKYSTEYEIPPQVVESVVKIESSYNKNAIGDDGKSFGLMQIQLPTASDIGFSHNKDKLMWPSYNIKYGTKYLKWIKNWSNGRVKGFHNILDCYNRGIGNCTKWPYKGDWKKHKYVGKILEFLDSDKPKCEYHKFNSLQRPRI